MRKRLHFLCKFIVSVMTSVQNHIVSNSGKAEFVAVYGRRRDFVEETGVRHGILPTLITTFGIRPNAHSAIAQVQLTMDDLFDDMG